uniref:RanBP2-type domain-containing protein n=1 Tax=Moschus moschiferus TaxID=68415 RepID=A0A8C6D402_MOSMO
MAVDFGDHASGFRHINVIKFINNEVLVNGGGPDFYVALRSRPWNEVEDQLRIVVADPRVPCAIKRACAWSALALSVRVGARQWEQQAYHIRRLQEQVGEREAASWALANELKRLREEHEEAAVHLRSTRFTLKQVIDERDMLRGRLLQLERSAQLPPVAHEMLPGPGAEQSGTTAWSMSVPEHDNMVAMGAQGMPHSESQMAAPAAMVYVPGPQNSFAQAIQPLPPMPVPHPCLCHVSFPMGFPYVTPLPPSAFMEGEGVMAAAVPVAVAPQIPSLGIYSPGQWAAVGGQEEMAPPYDQSFYAQEEYSENLQGEYAQEAHRSHSQEEGAMCPHGMSYLGGSKSNSQEEGVVCPQGMSSLGGSRSQSREEGAVCPQGMSSLGDSRSQSREEGAVCPQGMSSVGGSRSQSREEGAVGSQSREEDAVCPQGMSSVEGSRSQSREEGAMCSQGMSSLGDSRSQSREEGVVRPQGISHSREEGPVCPQGTAPQGDSRSHSQEEGPVCPQGTVPQGDSKSHKGPESKSPKKQEQKAKQSKEKRSSDYQHQQKPAIHSSENCWQCLGCKAVNFPWRMACYKCKKVCREAERGGLDPEQAH